MESTLTPDTICAISTPPGKGGIAVARISGPDAIRICSRIWRGKPLEQADTHTAHLGTVCDSDHQPLDQAVATVFLAPHSFTGEDVVELSVHGSKFVQRQLIKSLIDNGARLASPGEFTRRAFTSGKIDLTQAEAIADIIAAESRAAHRIASRQMRGNFSSRIRQLRDDLINLASLLELELDFSEEDVEFASRDQLLTTAKNISAELQRLSQSFAAATVIKEGIPVAIIGATNAGKSSLLNALTDDDRAIVSDTHGTTRDIIEDTITIGDYRFRLMDTAGLRHTDDTIENLGIERSLQAAQKASIILLVIDATHPVIPQIPATDATIIIAINKTDLNSHPDLPTLSPNIPADSPHINISARTGEGIATLREIIQQKANRTDIAETDILVTNARHYQAITRAKESADRAIDSIQQQLSGDLIALDIRDTINHLSEIIGDISSQTILSTIFSRFCIGK